MWSKISWKKCLSSYFIRLYERQNCPESDLYGSTQVESPICRARSQICTQYRLGVRFVRACHLALVCYLEQFPTHSTTSASLFGIRVTSNLWPRFYNIQEMVVCTNKFKTWISQEPKNAKSTHYHFWKDNKQTFPEISIFIFSIQYILRNWLMNFQK